jgi:protocatechuate 3,4-dioxygenase beta subunit
MKYSKILGIKAADLNRNGARDQGEPGLKNWEIVLTGILLNGTPIRPQVAFTDDFGYYEFTNLTAGSYQVSEVMQPGWHNYSVQSYSFSLGSGMSMARDFLNMPSGSISGSKFEDLNLNGRWDIGEPGVAGWTIYLTGIDANNAVVSISTTTDAAGHYSFTGLIPGMYYVSEESRAGWFPTTPSPLPVDVSALDPFVITDQNFGNARYGSITGNKWLDLNMNGIQDGAEPNLPGWTIVLDGYQADGTHVHLVTVTDACGNYAFLNLKPGVYTVTEELQDGWINITPLSREITIIEGSDVTCGKFGNVPFGSIAGWKFYDWDLDQMKDGNEPGIPGWEITLTGVLTNGRPVGPIVVHTDANGVWSFDNLLPGSYCVTEEQIAGWHNTTPIQLHLDIIPFWQLDQSGHVIFVGVTHVRDVKFGNVPLTCITGTKYNDLNGNGIRDPNEPGIPDWLIEVYGGLNNDHLVLTDQDGNYRVCGLLPGIYIIAEESREGWAHTTPSEYTLDVSSPRAPAAYVFDFGNFQLGIITGSKWEDMNGNGILDAGDRPIQGWMIYLDKVGGGTISVPTDPNGNFQFDNVPAGSYQLREENRVDWVHMNPSITPIFSITSGSIVVAPPFLNVHLSTVTGCKFDDLNGNGIRDPNEPGIAGWTIYMIWDRDPTVYQAITDERGCYQFTGLMPDTFYEVYESQRPDWTPTNQTWEVFSIVSGTTHHVHDFGNFQNAVITVFKYEDMTHNGIYDDHDVPLSGWHFIVSGPGILGGSAEVVTDASGLAYLTVTAAGQYTVTEMEQVLWCPTTATVQYVTVTSGSASPRVVMFGNFRCVDVTLFKYEDVNSNGVYDDGVDNPIEGWTFYLTSEGGVRMTVVTDDGGYVILRFCSADMWYVSEERRDGWIPVNPVDGRVSFITVSGHVYQCPTGREQYQYDFGNFNQVQICVFKFWDTCSDGFYTPGVDEPLPGWWIGLYDSQGNLIAWGFTNNDGRICFTVDKAGTYTVREEDRNGWSHIVPASGYWTIGVVSGDEWSLEFANYLDVRIPIFKYEDRNCNGIYDDGDTPIPGWHFELVRTGDGWTFSGVTDGNGMLTITVNRSGIYRLTEEARPGWTPVNPASGRVLITLTSGTIVPLQMFGNFHNVLIPVFKFSDADGDGYYSQAAGDSPLEGWHFYLWKEVSPGNWEIVNTNVTDVHGHTEFIVTDCGHYRITEESRDGWFWISPLDGQYTFWICSGKVFEVPFCFANFKLGTITVYKFDDLNGNGRLDQGEPGLPGWTIEIMSQGPFFWYQWGTTGADGSCVFTGLPPGWFTVWEDGQAGWIPTSPSSVSVLVMGNTHAQVYFLNFHKGCIEGYKYNDVNGNGVYDPGVDIPIEDWEITLAITTGVVGDPPMSAIAIIGTTHTDEDGHYEFCDLGPGIYVVSEEQRQPWVPMTPTSEQVVMTSGATIRIHDFLNYAPGSICGFKYEDVNCNGVYDPGIDRPIEGWKISMIEDALPEVHVTYTNSDGYWCYDNLRADYYLVWEESREHWTATSPTWAEVTITSGMDYQVDPFLNFHNVSIPIFKYDDVNGDGIYEQGTDVPLQGWSFTVTGPGVPGGSMTVLTGPDGRASVEVNCSGTYAVSEAHVTGWKNTTPDSLSVTVQSGDVLDPLRFGNFQLGRLFGIKSYDWNVNGSRDAAELGLGDWEVVLTGTLVNGTPIRPQVVLTDDNGFYEFTDLLAGSYVVSEIVKPGWVPTSPPSVPFGVFSGTNKGVIFNNALYGIVEGYKFYDKNMNGVRNGNEPGLAGWVIHLDGATDHGIPVHMVTTTDSNGHYAFTVQPGHYLVTEELLGSEWQATTPSPQVVETSGAMETFDVTVNVGNVRFATIWGYKFLDTYCQSYPFWPNGVFDLNEVGIGNWRITLQGYTDTGVRVDLETFTDNIGVIGHYAFTQVLPGTYWINETLRYGFAATTPYAVLMNVYPFPQGPVVIRRDFGNLLPSADPTMPFLLEKGWNLWSSPLMVTGLTAKGLLSAIGANGMAVTRLDESQGRYFSYVKGYNDSYDFSITLGDGYYVYVKQKTQFTLTGEFEQTSSTHVLKGWNIVGYTKLQPMKASVLLASLTGCHAKAVTYLDAATGIYHSYVKGYPAAFDFTVTQGRSYFLWVDGAGTLTL